MKVEVVPQAWVHRVWDGVEKFIADALAHSKGDYTVDQVKAFVAHGQWALLVATDEDGMIHGAAVVNFFSRPNDHVAFIVAIGGKLVSNPETFEQLKAYAVCMGATTIEGAARESIARLWKRYGFEEKYRIVGVRL